jgi:hypothetical protein
MIEKDYNNIYIDYSFTNNYREMKIYDPKIIDDNLKQLKISPIDILIKLKNSNPEYEIQECCLLRNELASLYKHGQRHYYIIKSKFLNIYGIGKSHCKRTARLYSCQIFLSKLYQEENWGFLEDKYSNKIKNK